MVVTTIILGEMARLADEIRMNKPFSLAEEEATLSIIRTAELLQQRATQILKPFDLTGSQYNVLRILRGARDVGLPCSQIAERMIARDPDITRLLDRLESRALVRRGREGNDRRVVLVQITTDGLRLLEEIDPVLTAHHRRQFSNLCGAKIQELIKLLELARDTSNAN